jgi:hypothetical protein
MKYEIIELNQNNYQDYVLFCKKSQKQLPGYKNKESWITGNWITGN